MGALEQGSAKDRRSLPSVRWLVIAGVVVVLGFLRVHLWAQPSESHWAVETLRAQGTVEDIADFGQPPIPDSENAAVVYRRAFDRLKTLLPEDQDALKAFTDRRAGPATEEQVARVRDLVSDHEEMLAQIEEGSRQPRCTFDAQWERLYNADLEYLGQMRSALWLLLARARMQAIDEEYDEAIGDLRTAIRFSVSAHGQPSLTCELVACVFEWMTIENVQDLCAAIPLDARSADALRADLAAIRDKDTLDYALAAERVLMLTTIRKARTGEVGFNISSDDEPLYLPKHLRGLLIDFDEEERWCVEYFDKIEAFLACPYHEVHGDIDALQADAEANIESRRLVLLSLLFPAISKAAAERAARGARIDVTRMGLAAYAYRAENGQWPDAPPVVFTDPFDGKPLRYRVDGDDVVIWSVDEDLVDDEGVPWRNEGILPRQGDLVWRLSGGNASGDGAPNDEASGEETSRDETSDGRR